MQFSNDPGRDYVEVVVELRSSAGRSTLTDWCATRGLTCAQMVEGMLISGSRVQLEAAFGQAVPDRTRLTRLAPPPELHDVIESVIVLPIPHLHGDQVTSRG